MAKKIALIGADGFASPKGQPQLRCFPWDRLSSIKNLRDFHDVIVNVGSIAAAKKIDWQAYRRVFTTETMGDILRTGGRIIIVGDPRFELPGNSNDGPISQHVTENVLSWTRLGLGWEDGPGETVLFDDEWYDRDTFARYLSHLKRWSYSQRGFNPDGDEIKRAFRVVQYLEEHADQRFMIEVQPFLLSRYGTVLAGEVRLGIDRLTNRVPWEHNVMAQRVIQFGSLIFLPMVNLPQTEALRILLEDACGLTLTTEQPSWAEEFEVPGQDALESSLVEIEEEIRDAQQRREAALDRIAALREPVRLLYSQHTELEQAVRNVLAYLGADVECVEKSDDEDGWISVRVGDVVRHGVLEVKGTAKEMFNEDGLKQLGGWVTKGIHDRGWKCKGIFVGNAAIGVPPDERSWPFSNSFQQKAELQNVVVLLATDLFCAYHDKAAGTFDAERFWTQLFETDGIFRYDEGQSQS